jgi:hypothetical protein
MKITIDDAHTVACDTVELDSRSSCVRPKAVAASAIADDSRSPSAR